MNLLWIIHDVIKEPLFDDVKVGVVELSSPSNRWISLDNRLLESNLAVVFNVGLSVEIEESVG